MPFGGFVNALPPELFILVHLVALLIGAYFAAQSFRAGAATFGWGFALYALAEIFYITYHLDLTVVLFAHTLAEVLDLLAFILLFAGISQTVLAARRARA
ncbi:MAG: hypothetical protein KNN16_03860 [Thermoflexus hugenholtzii]|jgi:hypothetical protein|uniref:hypothetical protein n=1 Tax=Thermoflexus TaxID=1495649 RepID=UPI001C74CCDA|nr:MULTISPECIES: hypothetical protein [Thermoflexus]QWK11422.1 MAG: hypothetical protein KNN16_03860 [Thermoflexus hugenholtzii]